MDHLAWAPDGRNIAYITGTPKKRSLRVFDPATGTVHPVDLGSADAELGNVVIGSDSAHIVALVRKQHADLETLRLGHDGIW